MRVEEIALRQEIRQMLNEAGINRETLQEMALKLLQDEIEKKVDRAVNSPRIERAINSKFESYEFRNMLKSVISEVIRESIKIHVDVMAENKCKSEENNE